MKEEFDRAILKVVSETAFISGKYAKEFEESFAEYLGAGYCVGVANGTDALEIALRAMGVGAGDEVLVPAATFFATAEAVSNIGAKPVFVDVDEKTYNLDPARIEEKITSRTKTILVVHLYGLPAEMDEIMALAGRHRLTILEDCSQAHGARYKGKTVGTFGEAATFSFYPSKNLGAFGDAGAIVSGSAELIEKARLIANHGQIAKNRHSLVGRNSRLDGIQAAVLSVKLPHLDGWLEARRRHAETYRRLLTGSDLVLPFAPEHARHTYHLYVVQVANREKVIAKLAEEGIETGLHYPTAVPFLEAYGHLNHKAADFPVAAAQAGKILSLPMYAELTDEMIETVCRSLKNAVAWSITN